MIGKSAWCREQGIYPAELDKWFTRATAVWTLLTADGAIDWRKLS